MNKAKALENLKNREQTLDNAMKKVPWEGFFSWPIRAKNFRAEIRDLERIISQQIVEGDFKLLSQKRFAELLNSTDEYSVEYTGYWIKLVCVPNYQKGKSTWVFTLPGVGTVLTK